MESIQAIKYGEMQTEKKMVFYFEFFVEPPYCFP